MFIANPVPKGFVHFECGRCSAHCFHDQAALDAHARQCAEREKPTMGAYASAAQEAKDREPTGAAWRMGVDAENQRRADAAFATFDKARAAGLYGASGATEMFTRAEVLAVLKSRAAGPHCSDGARELDTLISIFGRME